MELKYGKAAELKKQQLTFNRTIMELKFRISMRGLYLSALLIVP